jgi:hypothetical protein
MSLIFIRFIKRTGFSDPHTIEYKYTPEQAGKHVVMITWAGKEIPRYKLL